MYPLEVNNIQRFTFEGTAPPKRGQFVDFEPCFGCDSTFHNTETYTAIGASTYDDILYLITIKIFQNCTHTPTVPLAFGKDLRWITQTLCCDWSKTGQKGRHVILCPIMYKWTNFMANFKVWAPFRIFKCNCQLYVKSHAKTACLWTSQRGQSERSRDMFGVQRIWCSGLFWGSTISM